jgi:hypothetical protein
MYLSYSGLKAWELCPRQYYHRYVKKTVTPKPMNRVNTLYGLIVGAIFERFYKERMWRIPDFLNVMLASIPSVTEQIIADESEEGSNAVVDFTEKGGRSMYKSKEELIADVRTAIPRGIQSIKFHRLVGKEAGAEVPLDSFINGHKLGGRADFVIRRVPPHDDLVLIDGKGSKFRDDYIDRRQLRWYCLLHEEKFRTIPDKTGFLFWRSDPETSIEWNPVTKEDTAVLRQMALDTIEIIEGRQRHLPIVPEPTREQIAGAFPAQPSKDCKWCDYQGVCEEGTRFMKNKGKAPDPVSVDGPDAEGVEDIGL